MSELWRCTCCFKQWDQNEFSISYGLCNTCREKKPKPSPLDLEYFELYSRYFFPKVKKQPIIKIGRTWLGLEFSYVVKEPKKETLMTPETQHYVAFWENFRNTS